MVSWYLLPCNYWQRNTCTSELRMWFPEPCNYWQRNFRTPEQQSDYSTFTYLSFTHKEQDWQADVLEINESAKWQNDLSRKITSCIYSKQHLIWLKIVSCNNTWPKLYHASIRDWKLYYATVRDWKLYHATTIRDWKLYRATIRDWKLYHTRARLCALKKIVVF